MSVDHYGRPIVSMWINGSQLFDLRSMIKAAVKEFDAKFTGNKLVRINERFDCECSSRIYKKGTDRQPVDLFGIIMQSREKGYFISMVEPNPAKARNVQVYAKLWMPGVRGGKGYYQEVMHFVYHPSVDGKPSKLVELRYVPDCSGGVAGQ